MYNKRLIQQMVVVDEMQDSVVKISGESISPTASKSVSSSNNEPSPSPSTCRDWHNHYEKYNRLKSGDILSISPVRTLRNAPGGEKKSDEDPKLP
jgi:hypothetical protein